MGPANIGSLVENLGGVARESQKKDVGGNTVGFHTEFLRKMAASTVLDKYTINGKPVPVGEANVQALNGRTGPGEGGNTVIVSYSEDDGRDVSKNALAFMRQLEQHVQDPVKRHFLTLLMGMTNFNGGGHPLSAKRIGLIWNAIQLDRIGKMSPDELRDDPYVARTLMRNGRQFRSGDSTINERNEALDMISQ